MYILTKYKQECIYTESWNNVIEAIADEGLENNCYVYREEGNNNLRDLTDYAIDCARNWDADCREERADLLANAPIVL